MQVPLSWLKEYVPISIPVKELAHKLTMAGTEIGGVATVGGSWDNVFVGLVTKVEQHPNADRLKLATVDIGSEPITVVCGAPNVAEGQKVSFAKAGARLINPRSGELETLKAAKIRGVVSEGMVCSNRELGLGDDHTGILVLDETAPIGLPLSQYLGDAILEAEVTPNRPDCLSILGIAHEVAALTGTQVEEPLISYPEEGNPIESQVGIRIDDPVLCYRYTASLITGIKIGPSPRWMQERLLRAGQRPINSIVDITNYVMLEYGQPLHAFDYRALKDRSIIIRSARPGETLETLDGELRQLSPPMLVIADATDAVGLAGVMGGANSEMTASTTAVLLESANFNPVNTRRTAAALRLRTEASLRFEKGLRPELAPIALRRATQLILELAGGKVARGIVDLYPGRQERPPMKLSLARIKKVLGVDLSLKEVEQVLLSLGFERAEEPQHTTEASEEVSVLWVHVPYWRSDITLEDDLVEEVARITAYDKIPTTMLTAPIPQSQPQPMRELREELKDILAASGMQEIISYSLTSMATLEMVEALNHGPQPLAIANPLSSELQYLRTTLRGSLLNTLTANIRQQEREIRIFELGRIYLPRDKDLPQERETLAGVLCGPRLQTSWLGEEGDMNFFDAKGLLESLFSQLRVRTAYEPTKDSLFHPGRCAKIVSDERMLGVLGEVHPRILERFDLEGSCVAFFEVDLEALCQSMPASAVRYETVPRFPGAARDIALVVGQDIPSVEMERIIQRHSLVTQVSVFDVYTGPGVSSGKKSVAYRVLFQSATGTLTTEEINQAQKEILHNLEREVGAQLRGGS